MWSVVIATMVGMAVVTGAGRAAAQDAAEQDATRTYAAAGVQTTSRGLAWDLRSSRLEFFTS